MLCMHEDDPIPARLLPLPDDAQRLLRLTGGKPGSDREAGPFGGALEVCTLPEDPAQWYLRYLPPAAGPATPILVCVHGITRNAWDMTAMLAPHCAARGVALLAPLFTRERHRHYQRLAQPAHGLRPDRVIDFMVQTLQQRLRSDGLPIYLFGFSGGGQLAHRYAFAYPERVAAVAIGAAGWYTFPEPARAYPFGIATAAPGLPPMQPERFLRIPACVLIGERDVRRDSSLNQSPEIDAQQGHTRLERAQRWIAAMHNQARAYGYTTRYELRPLTRAGHSFARCATRGGLATAMFDFLLGEGLV